MPFQVANWRQGGVLAQATSSHKRILMVGSQNGTGSCYVVEAREEKQAKYGVVVGRGVEKLPTFVHVGVM